MANEEFYTTLIALVLLVIVAVIAVRSCSGGMSNFGSFGDVYTITLTTNKSYTGINSLVSEITKIQTTNMLYVVNNGTAMSVVVRATTNKSLKDNDVVVSDSLGFSKKYTNRASKNAIWNTDQSASIRAPAFLTMFLIKSMKIPDSYAKRIISPKVQYYSFISKSPSIHLALLADRLSEEYSKYQLLSPSGQKNEFHAYTDARLPENEVLISYGIGNTLASKRFSNIDTKRVWNGNTLDSFLVATGIFPELQEARGCGFADKKASAPPSPDVCDEKANHCYMLRAYSSPRDCATNSNREELSAVTNAYNRALQSKGITHRSNKKPVRFYGVHLQETGLEDSSRIYAAIDRSDMVIDENIASVQTAMRNNDFKGIESHIVNYLTLGGGERMSAGPQQYY
jgi:hypothetical protein